MGVTFPTVEYGLFFLVTFAAAWALRRHGVAHRGFLLAASYLFYAAWDLRFLPTLFGLSLLAAWVAKALESTADARLRRWVLGVGVAAALGTLALFKYAGFAAAALLGGLELLGVRFAGARLPEVALPVGVSFFTFHAISLMVDAYRGRIPVKVRTLDALLYVAFFPQLVAGPILRAASFLPQLAQAPDPSRIEAGRAVRLIVFGLVKKVLIAQALATGLVDPVFESAAGHSSVDVWLAIYGYAAQIYCDFSGYTDLALGSALLLGYPLPQNFDAPYRATSPRDFWQRWHLSLSTWLRDYLYIPLGGSRGTRGRTLLALTATMVLGGLWHGAAWTFVLWGGYHAAGLVAHRLWAGWQAPAVLALRAHAGWNLLAQLFTFHFVCLGWVLFRAPTVGVAGQVLQALLAGTSGSQVSLALLGAIAVGLFSQRVSASAIARATAAFSRWPIAAQGAALGVAVAAVEVLGPRGIAPFIYFRF